jgi:hypothetical protein
MFLDESLQNHLEESSVVKLNSKVTAEWNMNIPSNILQIGNYRYRPTAGVENPYGAIMQSFSLNDEGNFYTGATDSDAVVDGGVDDEDIPTTFASPKEKEKMLFSLEDCFSKNRPRSGINKARYFDGNNSYFHFSSPYMADRPRYYMADRGDVFKYWSSFRQDGVEERGVSYRIDGNQRNYIDDAAPYVVYKDPIPANRIITKLQTHIGEKDLGSFSSSGQSISDPFYGDSNKKVPVKWRIQYLKNSSWIDAVRFDENTERFDGSSLFSSDGYVELSYGLLVPEIFIRNFSFISEYPSVESLPDPLGFQDGTAYLVKNSDSDKGTFHVVSNGAYQSFVPTYGWYLGEEGVESSTAFVSELVGPPSYIEQSTGEVAYRDFQYIEGLRIVVETMNTLDSSLELIELSPRLAVDLSDKTQKYSISKSASDLGVSGLPVSQLLAATGSIELFDYDQAFFDSNLNSIVSKYLSQHIQFKFYEEILDVGGVNYYIPIKTMYADGFPQINSQTRSVSIQLRDLFYYFESQLAPQILIPNCSVSYAICLLLDSIGFSNYSIRRLDGDSDPQIPFFFVEPDQTVAEVLNKIAVSAQMAMFFDEYNNFIAVTKEYMMPDAGQRDTDMVLKGTKDFAKNFEIKNAQLSEKLANIIDISFQNREVFNNGSVNYTTRYLQRSYSSLKQASLIDREKTWVYKPVLLWEISPTEQTKPINDEVSSQSSYVLGAIPLNSDLTNTVPSVKNNRLADSFIDLGDGVYWITRYNGYLYANGEVIKYDAVQFSVPGLSASSNDPNVDGDSVWITSVQEYSKYFSQIPFNGKMFPTGLVRVYTEPNYEVIGEATFLKNGPVAKHGRGQFGTEVTYHNAGLPAYWSNSNNVRGCDMQFSYLYDDTLTIPETFIGPAGVSNARAQDTTRTGLIKNFLATQPEEDGSSTFQYPATVQSSAFVFNGTSFSTTQTPLDFVSYVHKPLDDRFVHFGTRMRIVGQVQDSEIRGQSPVGAFTYYRPIETRSDQPSSVAGASGGIACLLNPDTNNGYYFEIVALTDTNISDYQGQNIYNMLFYKIKKQAGDNAQAVPIRLWGGVGDILVDSGKFVGQSRMSNEENTTVYDLAVEYENIGNTRRFYLYINNVNIAIVDDPEPLPAYNNMALFVRGSSQCMFENVYAMGHNYSQNTTFSLDTPSIASGIFGESDINANRSFQKYSLSGLIQSSYLSGLGPSEPPKYKIYFEEFGTIMREAAYFNVRYDKAYPALYSKLSPTINKVKGYTVSNYMSRAYGAEFMVFNATDTALSLDSTSGNYLRIQGITFTQQGTHELTVDEYFNKALDGTSIPMSGSNVVYPPGKARQDYFDIKQSRSTNGNKSFTLEVPYIQSHDAAEDLMGWMIGKIMKPKKSVGLQIFSTPTLQLGDIVTVDYTNNSGVQEIAEAETQFVVYHIDYERDKDGPTMKVYLSEVG